MRRLIVLAMAAALGLVLCSCGGVTSGALPTSKSTLAAATPARAWVKHTPMYIAHRGGDADWPEDSAYAYAKAAAWNPNLALEVSVRQTSDGVWVLSEDPTTGRVFGVDDTISDTPWSVLSTLRSVRGAQPMSRLINNVLQVYGSNRILFIEDKDSTQIGPLLRLLDTYAGPKRYIIKTYWAGQAAAELAHAQGYLVWGYYFAKDMGNFASTESSYDLLGLAYRASPADFSTMLATGKPVIAHVIHSMVTANEMLSYGVSGLMVSDVADVVPH